MKLHFAVSLILILKVSSAAGQTSNTPERRRLTEEIVLFSGGSVHPRAVPLVGFQYGLGPGKNVFNFEAVYQRLDNYALGLGQSFLAFSNIPQFPGTIAHSKIIDIGGNFQRDLWGNKPLVYATAGAGWVWSDYSTTTPCASGIACSFPRTILTPIEQDQHTAAFKVGGGLGSRLPLWRYLSLRAEVKYWNVAGGGNIPVGGRTLTFSVPGDHILRTTIGLSIRHRYRGMWMH